MSSYEVGGIDVAGALVAGPIAIGAALAVLMPVAGGYAVYKAGKAVRDELVWEHREALEKKHREQALLRQRLERAKKVHEEILQECHKNINELNNSEFLKNEELRGLVNDTIKELNKVSHGEISDDVVKLEVQNANTIKIIEGLMHRIKEESASIIQNKENSERFTAFIEFIEEKFASLSPDEYFYAHNICIDSKEKVLFRKLNKKIETLIVEFYTIINREIQRFETVPISSVDVNRIAGLFDSIKREIDAIRNHESEMWLLEKRIVSLEKKLETYSTYKALLDKEQEQFLTLYLRYKKSCEEAGEECRDAVEFESLDELERTIEFRCKQLERMKKCSELYAEIKKEAYLCTAFEIEINKLNYVPAEQSFAESLVGRKLHNAHIKKKISPFFEYENDSVMRVYKVNDEVALQLIIHKDGSSTMETIALNGAEEDRVKAIQKQHCKKSKKLSEALKKNWFITAEFDETMSADQVAIAFSQETKIETSILKNAQNKAERRKKLARDEQRRKNREKEKLRSKALHF